MATGQNKNLRNSTFVKGLQSEQMKVHIEFINPGVDDRPKFIYEANADTTDGQSCLKTAYVYVGTSSQVLYSIEIETVWDGAYDTDAEAIAQAATPPYSVKG